MIHRIKCRIHLLDFSKFWFNFLHIFCLTAHFAHAGPSQIILGKARFTVITPECIRMEYSENSRFEDSPTLFAINRNVRYSDSEVIQGLDFLTISTGKIRLNYTVNHEPFNERNLHAEILSNHHQSVPWSPESRDTRNLGGTIASLDGIKGAISLPSGLLSRSGWFL